MRQKSPRWKHKVPSFKPEGKTTIKVNVSITGQCGEWSSLAGPRGTTWTLAGTNNSPSPRPGPILYVCVRTCRRVDSRTAEQGHDQGNAMSAALVSKDGWGSQYCGIGDRMAVNNIYPDGWTFNLLHFSIVLYFFLSQFLSIFCIEIIWEFHLIDTGHPRIYV